MLHLPRPCLFCGRWALLSLYEADMLTDLPRRTPPKAGQEWQFGSRRRFTAAAVGLMCRSQSTDYVFGLQCFFLSTSLHSFCVGASCCFWQLLEEAELWNEKNLPILADHVWSPKALLSLKKLHKSYNITTILLQYCSIEKAFISDTEHIGYTYYFSISNTMQN